MTAFLAVLLADPMVQSILIGLASIVAHKYFPILDGLLSKLPGLTPPDAPAPGSFSAAHPVVTALEARLVTLEQALLKSFSNPGQLPSTTPVLPK